MALNILTFIKSLLPSVQKTDIENDIELSLEAISTIQTEYNNLRDILEVTPLQSKNSKNIIKSIYTELNKFKPDVDLTRKQDIAKDTITLFSNAKINGEYIYEQIRDTVNDVVVTEALTAARANIFRSVAHYFFMTRYALDLLNYIYIQESKLALSELDKGFKLNKKQEEFITKNSWVYARLLSVYGSSSSKFKDHLQSIESISVSKNKLDEVEDMYSSNKLDLFNNLPNGFIGSPIYSVRLIFAQWTADRHRNLKDKKKLLELRVLHLRLLKEQNQSDVSVEKEIQYLQNRLDDIDYSIAKIEQDL